MNAFGDIAPGQVFGRLTVTEASEPRRGSAYWKCSCACGGTSVVRAWRLRTGETLSCGCLQRESVSTRNYRHGMTRSREHNAWSKMIQRCADPNYRFFNRYGGRGITVCERWRDSFEAFASDMGMAPSPQHSIDRIDNDGHYEPGNCRWATRLEQARNTSRNRILTAFGRSQCLQAWADELGLCSTSLIERLDRGWDVERAVSTPPRASRRNRKALGIAVPPLAELIDALERGEHRRS